MTRLVGLLCCVVLAGSATAFQDPMKPTVGRSAVANPGSVIEGESESEINSELKLNSIIFSDKRKIAIINQTLAAEGDVVNGAVVLKIKQTSVLVDKLGEELELHFASTRKNAVVKQVW